MPYQWANMIPRSPRGLFCRIPQFEHNLKNDLRSEFTLPGRNYIQGSITIRPAALLKCLDKVVTLGLSSRRVWILGPNEDMDTLCPYNWSILMSVCLSDFTAQAVSTFPILQTISQRTMPSLPPSLTLRPDLSSPCVAAIGEVWVCCLMDGICWIMIEIYCLMDGIFWIKIGIRCLIDAICWIKIEICCLMNGIFWIKIALCCFMDGIFGLRSESVELKSGSVGLLTGSVGLVLGFD
ncbi:hypothetical protein J6590_051383 [Homalodisca vitripennis]|nr:hypothetical protein J6590_051383 [Homalodisca vitripennis]